MKRWYKIFQVLFKVFIPKERKTAAAIGFWKKIGMWRRGFLSNKYILYQLDRNNSRDYLSDYERTLKTYRINRQYREILDDKLFFSLLVRKFGDYAPEVYGVIARGRVHLIDPQKKQSETDFLEFLREKDRVVLKPQRGGGGRGIRIVAFEKGNIVENGKPAPAEQFLARLKELDFHLICEYICQHSYASTIFPLTPNTIRIVTMWDDELDRPFIAAAVHRFGCASTVPVDNFTQGGASAKIDLRTGQMENVAVVKDGKLEFGETHPETGEPVKGVIVPHWETVAGEILNLAGALGFIPYIGWDVIITEQSFKILEANSYPDMDICQTHAVILNDPRVRAFYRSRGVIK